MLGAVVFADAGDEASHDPTAVAASDVVHAVEQALVTPLDSWWSVFHIQSESPGARFSVGDAKGALGYSPQVQFAR
ncbi:MAG: hypothetical protein HC802_03990 [Caldilineaceae bacterium]|nr:hypothetical protein [Caldilineaceae bacterium]